MFGQAIDRVVGFFRFVLFEVGFRFFDFFDDLGAVVRLREEFGAELEFARFEVGFDRVVASRLTGLRGEFFHRHAVFGAPNRDLNRVLVEVFIAEHFAEDLRRFVVGVGIDRNDRVFDRRARLFFAVFEADGANRFFVRFVRRDREHTAAATTAPE